MSDIEGKSCEGSSERAWATSEFQLGERGLEVFGIGKVGAVFEASQLIR